VGTAQLAGAVEGCAVAVLSQWRCVSTVSARRRRAGTAVFAVAFVILGLPDFGHGVAWPAMRSELNRPLVDLGSFLAVAAVGYLVIAITTGRLAKRWGIEGLVLRATLSSASGLFLVAVAPTWPVVLAGSALCGLGAGGMDTGFNAAVALRQDGRLMGLLHAGYGLGAAIGPIVMGASLAIGDGWRPAYGVFALASLLLVIPLAGKSLGEAPPQETMGSPRGMLLPCLAFFAYVSLEVTIGQWAFTSLTQHRGLGEFSASMFVGIYWIALTAGRLWLGLSGYRVSVPRLLGVAVAGAAVAAAILWLGGPVAPAGLVVAGLALSVVFPLLMLLTPARVGAARAAAAVGWQTAASSVGAAGGPAIAGIVLDRVGIEAYGPVALAMAGALAAAVVALGTGVSADSEALARQSLDT
jgi:fucose permease